MDEQLQRTDAEYPLKVSLNPGESVENIISIPEGHVFFWSGLDTTVDDSNVLISIRIDGSEVIDVVDLFSKDPTPFIVHKGIEVIFTSLSDEVVVIIFRPYGKLFVDIKKEQPICDTDFVSDPATTIKYLKNISELLERQRQLKEDVISISYPSSGTKQVTSGTTVIDFIDGRVILPDGSIEFTSGSLKSARRNFVRSVYIEADQDIEYQLDDGGRLPKNAFDFLSIPHLSFKQLRLYTTEITRFDILVSTNPDMVIRRHRYVGYPGVKRPKSYESSVTAGTPVSLTVFDDLSRLGSTGFVANDTNKDLRVYISDDGKNFHGGSSDGSSEYTTLKYLETLPFDGLKIHTIKLVSSSGTINYRCTVV